MEKFDIDGLVFEARYDLADYCGICTWTRIRIRKGRDKILAGSEARSAKCSFQATHCQIMPFTV